MKFYKLTPEYDRIKQELVRIGVDNYALNMVKKGVSLNILVRDIKAPAANILKQEAIASGMDAAVKRGAVSCSIDKTDVLLMGNAATFERLIKRLSVQVFGLKELGKELSLFLKSKEIKNITYHKGSIDISKPLCMGILNTTPDSFSDGSMYITEDAVAARINEMAELGVDIIDIGGMSSRPFSESISSDEEIKRIKFALDYIKQYDMIVSVDTNNYKTAEYALNHGADIINDISGMTDDNMVSVCGQAKCAVCIMHMQGSPKDMQTNANTEYNNIIYDIHHFFTKSIDKCLNAGIDYSSIILDVGFGFGKTVKQNYILLKYLREFKSFNLPLLAGISRKSMIGAVIDKDVNNRLAGTICANTAAILNGADIIRVHDIKEGIDTVKIADYILKANI